MRVQSVTRRLVTRQTEGAHEESDVPLRHSLHAYLLVSPPECIIVIVVIIIILPPGLLLTKSGGSGSKLSNCDESGLLAPRRHVSPPPRIMPLALLSHATHPQLTVPASFPQPSPLPYPSLPFPLTITRSKNPSH